MTDAKRCELAQLMKSSQKVPVLAWAFHVVPRQRMHEFAALYNGYSVACFLLGKFINAFELQAFAVTRIFLRRSPILPAVHRIPRRFMKCQI